MAITPKVVTQSEPITEIVKITQPVSTKNLAGAQINPATEDGNLASILSRLTYSGAIYRKQDVATVDTARRFETVAKKLRDIVIYISVNDQLFGDSANQTFLVSAGRYFGFTKVDISTLYFKNATAGQNGTIDIIGVLD